VEELTLTVDQLTTDLEERRRQADSVSAELQQTKLTLDVSTTTVSFSPSSSSMFVRLGHRSINVTHPFLQPFQSTEVIT